MNHLSNRQHFLGGSDAASVLGISPWKSPLDLYMQKTAEFVEPTNPGREAVLNRGKRMEPYVLDMLQAEAGVVVEHRNRQHLDAEFPFLACEVDAEAVDGRNIEVKTVSPFKAAEWGEVQTDAIPVHYTAQAMHGLMITGRDECVFAVLIGGDDFRVYRVQRDDETIAALREREVAFWTQHVLPRVPPAPSTGRDAERWFKPNDGLELFADHDLEMLQRVNRLRELKAQIKPMQAAADLLEDELKLAMKDATVLSIDGMPVVTWKPQIRRAFDTAAFKAANPELHAQFMKTTQYRVLRIK